MAGRFQRLPGSAKRYLDTQTGIEYSRRQYTKLTDPDKKTAPAKSLPRKRLEKQALEKRQVLYQSRAEYLRKQGVEVLSKGKNPTFRPISAGDVKQQAETKALIRRMQEINASRGRIKSGRNKGKVRPLTALQQQEMKIILTELGLRENIPWSVKVGMTEEKRRQQFQRRMRYNTAVPLGRVA